MADVRALSSEEEVIAALRRFKRRETLRIAYGDIVKGHSVAKVTRQISYVADAVVEAALDFATRQANEKQARRNGRGIRPPRFVVLALGKLGGRELNYSSDIDLVMLYQDAGANGGERERRRRICAAIALQRDPSADRADRPGVCLPGRHAAAARRRPGALGHSHRPCPGLLRLARPHLGTAGLREGSGYRGRHRAGQGISRSISSRGFTAVTCRWPTLPASRASSAASRSRPKTPGSPERNVKTGHGGIRDIEFAIQFLQLLNGGADCECPHGQHAHRHRAAGANRRADAPGAAPSWRITTLSRARWSIGCRSCLTCRRTSCPPATASWPSSPGGSTTAPAPRRRWRRFARTTPTARR